MSVSANANLHRPSTVDVDAYSLRRNRYRATVEGISISGTGHTLAQPGMLAYAISFLAPAWQGPVEDRHAGKR
ncbi:hypothetical protein [Kibdelosporangium aridum]|uniref:hypothetical protein n=1 Tax=Kibdelosporangium aridum TaxID=2030 RepID=UPI001C8B5D1D|nr:hypothetical protein [Kibdelosporangium aridum]